MAGYRAGRICQRQVTIAATDSFNRITDGHSEHAEDRTRIPLVIILRHGTSLAWTRVACMHFLRMTRVSQHLFNDER